MHVVLKYLVFLTFFFTYSYAQGICILPGHSYEEKEEIVQSQ